MTDIRAFYRLLEEVGEVPCQSAPTVFFDHEEMTRGEKIVNGRLARQLCGLCPVRLECLDYAVSNGEFQGVWGGLTEVERKRLRNDRAA